VRNRAAGVAQLPRERLTAGLPRRAGRGITDHVCVDVDGTLILWATGPGSCTEAEVAAATRNISAIAERRAEEIPAEDRHLVPRVNWPLVEELKKWANRRDGTIVIWTMGGPKHAELAMMLCGLDMGYRVECIAKPDLIVDDAGHDKLFARHRAVLPHEFKCPEA